MGKSRHWYPAPTKHGVFGGLPEKPISMPTPVDIKRRTSPPPYAYTKDKRVVLATTMSGYKKTYSYYIQGVVK